MQNSSINMCSTLTGKTDVVAIVNMRIMFKSEQNLSSFLIFLCVCLNRIH